MSSQRNQEIANLYVNNTEHTLESIGKIYSISRERVRQIVEKVYPGYHRPAKLKPTYEELEARRIEKRIRKFWSSYSIDQDTNCWNWNLGKFPSGYGCCHFYGEQYAHRVSWLLSHGEIGETLHVLHKCDNPSCINPDHLYLGTHKENIRDREIRFKGIPFSRRNKFNTPKRTTN